MMIESQKKCFDLILYAAKIPNSLIVEFVYFFSIQDGQPIIQKMEVGFHNDEEDDVDDPDDEKEHLRSTLRPQRFR